MSVSTIDRPVSALRQRMLDDMAMRGLRSDTQRDYIRVVRSFAAFLGRSPDTATAEDIRRFQVHQHESGVQPPTINCSVSALRFFFTVTLDRPDLSRRLVLARYPLKLPAVLTVEEVGRLLEAAPGPKYKAILGTAYGAGLRVSEVASLKVDDIDSKRMLNSRRAGQGTQGSQRHAVTQLLTLLRLWWEEGKRRRVMLRHGWLFPGRSCTDPISARQINRATHEAAEAAGIKAGVAPYAAPQLRHPSAGAGRRHPCHPGPVGAQQARYDRALRARCDQDDPFGDQSSRAFGIRDAGRGTQRLNLLAHLARGRRYLPG